MANLLEIAGYIQDQGDRGRKRGLASLVGKAYGAPKEERQAILGAVASRGEPQMAYDANKHFGEMDEASLKQFGQYAAAFDALPEEMKAAEYPKFAQKAQQHGIPAPGDWNPAFSPNITKLAASLRGGGDNTVQSQKIDKDGQIWTTMRDGSMVPTGVIADRQMWLRDHPGMPTPETVDKNGVARPVGGAGYSQPPPQGQPPAPVENRDSFDKFIAPIMAQAEQSGQPLTSKELMTFYTQYQAGGAGNINMTGGVAAPQAAPPQPAPQAPAQQPWPPARPQPTSGVPQPQGYPGSGQAYARPSEAQTAAEVEAAKQDAQTAALGPRGVAEATNAGLKETATQSAQTAALAPREVAKARGEAAAAWPTVKSNAQLMIRTIDSLLAHPGRKIATGGSSVTDPRNFVPGRAGYDYKAKAKQIEGQAFLQAFNMLRGGGQITEVEGAKATAAMAALDQAQSEEQYEKALRDLREIADNAMKTHIEKMRGPQQSGGNYRVGQIIELSGKRYRVTDASDQNDPDLEEVR